jgi:hypothetical protein
LIGIVQSDEALSVFIPLTSKDAPTVVASIVGVKDGSGKIKFPDHGSSIIGSDSHHIGDQHICSDFAGNRISQILHFASGENKRSKVVMAERPQRPDWLTGGYELYENPTLYNSGCCAAGVEQHVRKITSCWLIPDISQNDARTMTGNELIFTEGGGLFGGGNGQFQLDALPTEDRQLQRPDYRQSAGQSYKPPIGPIFVFSIFAVCFGFFGSLWGWDNFYDGRKLFGAALIAGSWLLGAFGFFAWWGFPL